MVISSRKQTNMRGTQMRFVYSHPLRSLSPHFPFFYSLSLNCRRVALPLALFLFISTEPVKSEDINTYSDMTTIRVNCGGPQFKDAQGNIFEADRALTESNAWGFVGGSVGMAKSGVTVEGTENAPLFLSERWGLKEYRFQVQPGIYKVTLYFAEFFFSEPQKRLFDIAINGRKSIPTLDIVALAGQNRALQITRTVESTNGWIVLETTELVDRCKFSAIAIEPAVKDQEAPPSPDMLQAYPRSQEAGLNWAAAQSDDLKGYFMYRSESETGDFARVNDIPVEDAWFVDTSLPSNAVPSYKVTAVDYFGNESQPSKVVRCEASSSSNENRAYGINVGGKQFSDAKGRFFLADRVYNPGNGAGSLLPGFVTATPNDKITEPFRSLCQGDMIYRFDVPPDAYQVTLGFYDPFSRETKDRLFSVYLNDFRALDRLDLYEEYGRTLPVEIQRVFRVGPNGLEVRLKAQQGKPVLSFIYLEPTEADTKVPTRPVITQTIGRDDVAFLKWTPSDEPDVIGYQVLRAEKKPKAFVALTNGFAGVNSFVDHSVKNDRKYFYEVVALDASRNESSPSEPSEILPHFPSDDELLDMVSRAAFEYFAQECDPQTYLTRDKSTAEANSVAAMGFGLSALCVGVERGWMSRQEAERRAYLMLRALNNQPDNKVDGIFFHYLKGNGSRSGGGYEDVTSTVDTALLMWGALAAGEYFGGRIRSEAETMLQRMNWKPYVNENRKMVAMAFRPSNKSYDGLWDYYTDEAILVCLLGVGAPKPEFRIPDDFFYRFLRDRKNFKEFKDIVPSWSGSLFTYTFAHCWLDFRALGPDNPEKVGQPAELKVDWWTNSVKAILANKAFCQFLSKRYKTFGENAWGLSACSGPDGRYVVGGAPPCGGSAEPGEGTLALYSAGMSVPFVPRDAMAALKYYYTLKDEQGNKLLWRDEFDGGYGLRDSFNRDKNWYSDEVHGINHGPMLLLIENARSGLLWKTTIKNRFVRDALERVGFQLNKDEKNNKGGGG
ncbi:MAG: glucoamylase family protein [Lentisphaerota bacterium]